MALIVTILAMAAPLDSTDLSKYEPVYPWCNTPECDERSRNIRMKRKVQARHKAQVRAERQNARMRNRVRPLRAWLASTRRCESGGNYRTATGNGFWGAYQFTLSSWRAAGGWGMPHLASKLEQDYRAVILLGIQGRGAWPVCG